VPELLGERGRPEDPVTPDVDASQQDDKCHGCQLTFIIGARASATSTRS
jgi:hypothetical protein